MHPSVMVSLFLFIYSTHVIRCSSALSVVLQYKPWTSKNKKIKKVYVLLFTAALLN